VDEEIGVVGTLSLSAPKSCPFEAVARTRWTKFGKTSGAGLSFLYSASMAEPLKAFGKASSVSASMPSRRRRNDDCPSHFVRMADRSLHRQGSARAVADKVGSRDFEMVEQGGHVVGEVFAGDISWDVRAFRRQ
jgi:hypothetical protein